MSDLRLIVLHKAATWLILPVVICLSQRLSHACISINCLYSETANGNTQDETADELVSSPCLTTKLPNNM